MYIFELSAMLLYFSLLLTIGFFSYQKKISSDDFIMGSRSLNCWLTALAAHASDMSSWLFLGYPALVFSRGVVGIWVAIGLIFCMYLNWQWVALKIRVATEESNALTFSSFFETRLQDRSGLIRLFSALVLILFYTIYISASLKGMGELFSSLFSISDHLAIFLSLLIIVPYLFMGGYKTLAWIDLFQGCFLLIVILFVPLFLLYKREVGFFNHLTVPDLFLQLFPDRSLTGCWSILSMSLGWGLGYFGQPHIVTKFMGIRNAAELKRSKWIGMTWMLFSLTGATLVGLAGISFFHGVKIDPEQIFLQMVRSSFSPFIVGLILCAVLGATMNAMSSQILVMASSLTEDFYKKIVRPNASSKELLAVSRSGVIFSALIAFLIASHKENSIYSLVQYAWSGIGSSFAPLLLFSLYSSRINRYGGWAAILGGGAISALWPSLNPFPHLEISAIFPGMLGSSFLILLISHITRHKEGNLVH